MAMVLILLVLLLLVLFLHSLFKWWSRLHITTPIIITEKGTAPGNVATVSATGVMSVVRDIRGGASSEITNYPSSPATTINNPGTVTTINSPGTRWRTGGRAVAAITVRGMGAEGAAVALGLPVGLRGATWSLARP